MNLRGQVQLILFVFGLAPLIAVLLLNVPIVYERMQGFYQTAYLQNLRAEFNDLDQHLAIRKESLRWLAKFPEPGVLSEISKSKSVSDDLIEEQRSSYVEWLNHVLYDQLDIIEIQFFDNHSKNLLTLARNPVTHNFSSTSASVSITNKKFLQSALKIPAGGILAGSIQVNESAIEKDPRYFMTLQLMGPMIDLRQDKNKNIMASSVGAVSIRIDISGLAQAFPNTTWVLNNGRYARTMDFRTGDAFKDFTGLEDLFKKGSMTLWHADNDQSIFWVPLLLTETHGPLWVGRSVDPSALDSFNRSMLERLAIIVVSLLVLVWFVARWVANRTSRVSSELLNGVSDILTENRPLQLNWKNPAELKELAEKLDELARRHNENLKDIHMHTQNLEQSNRYKSEFLANVSHELRTPLNSILLLSRLLSQNKEQNLQLEQIQQAQVINNAGNDLKILIDNILDLSRIEAGRCVLHTDSVATNAIIEDVINVIKPQFDEKGIPLLYTDDTSVVITSDGDKIKQILLNFMSNALKFTSSGEISISVKLNPEFRDIIWAVGISVTDSGIGINEEKIQPIFEAFTQADGSTSRRYGGTGLGLTISRQLALLLDGEIGVTSKEGEGSCFTLYLPDKVSCMNDANDEETGADKSEIRPSAANGLEGKKLLIIDDDIRSVLSIKLVLDSFGVEVMAASDQEEAMETLNTEQRFDFVMVASETCTSPDMSILFSGIKKHISSKARIIALLSDKSDHSNDQCIDAGADAVIYNPLDIEQLQVILS